MNTSAEPTEADLWYPTGAILFLSFAICTAIAVGKWSEGEDLYMALCAGRDVLYGHLGQPDEWSFATDGRIWVNQGWLSGLIYYLSYVYLQELGPLFIKAALLILGLALIFVRCRWLGASTEVCFLAMTLGTLSVGRLMDVRADNFAVLYFILLTTFLVAPPTWGRWRQVGSLGVILIWANSHGSFMVGFFVIVVKTSTEIARYFGSPLLASYEESADRENIGFRRFLRVFSIGGESEDLLRSGTAREVRRAFNRRQIVLWALTCALCVPVMAFANPFGLANLSMPFEQVGAEWWTQNIGLWGPLIRSLVPLKTFAGKNGWPFLFSLALMLAMLFASVIILWSNRLPEVWWKSRRENIRSDFLVEALVCLAMVALTFRFGRTALFSGMVAIPIMAWLFQFSGDAILALARRFKARRFSALPGWLFAGLSTALLLFLTFMLVDNTIIPLLPGNPLFRSSSTAARIVGPLAINTAGTVSFLKDNRIKGRVFSNLVLADVLLFHVPGIKVFLDCRTQSIYSVEVAQEFRNVAEFEPGDKAAISRSLGILDARKVSVVALGWFGFAEAYHLAEALVKSTEWRAAYVDPAGYGFVFLRTDSELMRTFLQVGSLDNLRYPDEESRALSLAFAYLGKDGTIPHGLERQLKAIASMKPTALTYYAISKAHGRRNGCLDKELRSYLKAELERLSRRKVDVTQGGYWVLRSKLEILHLLDEDRRACGGDGQRVDYTASLVAAERSIELMRKEFLPWGVSWWGWP